MSPQNFRVVRTISNNAVFARADEQEVIVSGRGVGFGAKAGDLLSLDSPATHYVPLSPGKIHLLRSLEDIDPRIISAVSSAVDLAEDLLGKLHPSVHLLLSEHLTFAIQRVSAGEVIRNSLNEEIRAAFSPEYGAAELVLSYLNSQLEVSLPEDEAAFIALHLNAARTGSTVKQPLAAANALAGDLGIVYRHLGIAKDSWSDDHDLAVELMRFRRRLLSTPPRRNDAAHSIARDLPREFTAASMLACHVLSLSALPKQWLGEACFLAVYLHGWLSAREQSRT